MPAPNRIVAALAPMFAAVAAVGSAWLAKHFPGLPVSEPEIIALEVTGATAALGGALSWLHGHQQWEKRADEAARDVQKVAHVVAQADPALLKQIEQLVEAKVQGLLANITVAVGHPAAGEHVAPQTPVEPPA